MSMFPSLIKNQTLKRVYEYSHKLPRDQKYYTLNTLKTQCKVGMEIWKWQERKGLTSETFAMRTQNTQNVIILRKNKRLFIIKAIDRHITVFYVSKNATFNSLFRAGLMRWQNFLAISQRYRNLLST